jgi:hypothetical protein
MFKIENLEQFKIAIKETAQKVSSEAMGWIAILVLHSSTIPGLIAVMSGLSDAMLPLDLVLMIWAALTLFFIKAAVQKDMLNMVTITFGFIVQSVLIALIFFK